MKKVKVILTSATLALAICGVFVARANENKKRLAPSTTAYYNSGTVLFDIPSNLTGLQTTGSASKEAYIVIGSTSSTKIRLYDDASQTNALFVP